MAMRRYDDDTMTCEDEDDTDSAHRRTGLDLLREHSNTVDDKGEATKM